MRHLYFSTTWTLFLFLTLYLKWYVDSYEKSRLILKSSDPLNPLVTLAARRVLLLELIFRLLVVLVLLSPILYLISILK